MRWRATTLAISSHGPNTGGLAITGELAIDHAPVEPAQSNPRRFDEWEQNGDAA